MPKLLTGCHAIHSGTDTRKILGSLLEEAVAQDVKSEHKGHKADSQVKRHARNQVVNARFAFVGGADTASTRHGIALSSYEHEQGKYHRDEHREAQRDSIESFHSARDYTETGQSV